MSQTPPVNLEPVEGKFIYEIDSGMRIRFNADGWVEELVKPNEHAETATRLQGRAGTKRDDIMARRFYDLFARVVILNIYPRQENDSNIASGIIQFSNLEKNSIIYNRVSAAITIAKHLGVEVAPLT
jgi:hypothetical protein